MTYLTYMGRVFRRFLLAIVVIIYVKDVSAARIEVLVHEFGTRMPIPQADVQVFLPTPKESEQWRESGGKIPRNRKPDLVGVTGQNGTYSFDKVEGDRAVLRVKHVGFIKNPTDYDLRLDTNHRIETPLMDQVKVDAVTQSGEYVSEVMRTLKSLPGDGAQKAAVQWESLSAFSLPPQAKQVFASEIIKQVPAAREIPVIAAYSQTDPKKLQESYRRWRRNYDDTGAALPPDGVTNGVPVAVVADIFVDLLRNSDGGRQQIKSVIDQFNKTWSMDSPVKLEAFYRVPGPGRGTPDLQP